MRGITLLALAMAALPAVAFEKIAMVNCDAAQQGPEYQVAADIFGAKLDDDSWQVEHADIRLSQLTPPASPELTLGLWQDVPVTGEGLGLTFTGPGVRFFAFFDDMGGVSSIATNKQGEISLTCQFTEL